MCTYGKLTINKRGCLGRGVLRWQSHFSYLQKLTEQLKTTALTVYSLFSILNLVLGLVGQHPINGGNFSSTGQIISLVPYKDSSEGTENSLLSSPLPFKLGYPGDHSDR